MNNGSNFYVLRGKTDRRRKRDSKAQREKQLFKLYKKEQTLYEQQRNLGFEELETPYQKGFKRFFILRSDIHAEKQVVLYSAILALINTQQLSLRKDFKKRKRVRRKKIFVETKQDLKELTERDYKKMPEKYRPHFYKVEYHYLKSNLITIRYVFCEPWRFVLHVKPNMITHRRKMDADLNSEMRRLENHIDTHHLRPEFSKLRSKKQKRWKEPGPKPKDIQLPIYKLLKTNNEYN